ncbi:tail fiber protein [Hymenobacter sp. ASUV-10]|uniref:Tail fiber protein n=1 Tax=Hymenobacter aranciens TaxID=3063996 RepID=A0ABT9BK73_9BACT|nr:tail fiber protein [Hymenobacter sp. ASUV-10]MDO7877407.1 tail fiber protein [Hymenobacter sp. ASUV-10]
MDAFLGEVRAVGFNFAPMNWAFCSGQLMPINRYTALFSLLGTAYGGDGKTTFALPNLNGQAIVGVGQGPGLSPYVQGEVTGTESVTLLTDTMPPHLHTLGGSFLTQAEEGGSTDPTNNFLAATAENQYNENVGTGTMGANMIKGAAGPAGGNQPHSNMMPSLAINYIICLSGIFPPRS